MFGNIVVRILIILALGIAGVYVATQTYFWLVSIWLFAFMLLVAAGLVRYLTRTRRQLADFLLSVSQDDYTTRSFASGDSLDYAFKVLNRKLLELRSNRAANAQFMEALIEHVGVALIGYETDTEKITVLNGTAKSLFDKPVLTSLSSLGSVDKHLPEALRSIESGENHLQKIVSKGRVIHFSLTARELVLEDRPYKLVSLQDIQAELEAREAESWQKLIRVLTHEIKNSAIPISTLSEVIRDMIIDEDRNFRDLSGMEPAALEDLRLGLETIGRRSSALVGFVNAYSRLARLPEPDIETVGIRQLFNDVLRLFQEEFHKICLDINLEENLILEVDRGQMEQVIINIVKNAVEELQSRKDAKLSITAYTRNGRKFIEFRDNGNGMDADMMEQVFIPFYTTKSGGSGIGLSLTRQIIRAHKGEVRISSVKGEGTTFTLVL